MKADILKILNEGTTDQKKALFLFTKDTEPELVRRKFKYWAKWFFPKFFKSKDSPDHKLIDSYNVLAYLKGEDFLDIGFRGLAKTARTKLFIAFAIANDETHYRRSFKVLSEDLSNAQQSVTDIYNMLVKVKPLYPEIFEKTDAKRQETMSVFTTATGVKVLADSVGTGQRGDLQEDARPDFIWFDDFETRKTLMSAVTLHKIWMNMDEAYTGLEKGGTAVYTCNYLSERGNVHKLVQKVRNQINIPIERNGEPTWPDRYTKEDIKEIKRTAEDYEGDYLGKPSATKDIYFDRERLNRMVGIQPVKEIGDFKIFKPYNPSHKYAGGHDVSGGVGLDHSTSVFIDFDTVPAQVVATYKSNTILPEAFGDEITAQANKYGGCLIAIENNKYDQAILKAKLNGANLYKTQPRIIKIGHTPPITYGWSTNSLTKSQMLSALKSAIEDGLLDLNDPELIEEVKSYTRNDLIDHEPDIRLTTRHFDFVMALAIAWQMKDHAKPKPKVNYLDAIWQKQETNPAI